MPTSFCVLVHDSVTGLQITNKFQATEIGHICNKKFPHC